MSSSRRAYHQYTEKIIQTRPVLQTMTHLHFCIPVYRELYNQNLEKCVRQLEIQLRSLAQKNRTTQIVVTWIVNNSPEVATDKHSDIYLENLRTLDWLRQFQTQLKFQIIDRASDGTEKNMGKIRQMAVDEIFKNFPNHLRQQLIVHMDADIRLEDNFANDLLDEYESSPDLETVFLRRDYELRGEPSADLLMTHHHYRLKRINWDLLNIRTRLMRGLATYQITSRLETLQKIKGFKPLPKDEDAALAEDLIMQSCWALSGKIKVYAEDRARKDGFGAKKRLEQLSEKRLQPHQLKPFFLRLDLLHYFYFQMWRKVKMNECSFEEAFKQAKQKTEEILKIQLSVEYDEILHLAPQQRAQLPDLVVKEHSGIKYQLSPLAHIFAKTLSEPTSTPASDLLKLIKMQCSSDDSSSIEQKLQLHEKMYNSELAIRLQKIIALLKGEEIEAGKDVFLLWFTQSSEAKKIILQKSWFHFKNKEDTLKILCQNYPDWLHEYHQTPYRKEADLMHALVEHYVQQLQINDLQFNDKNLSRWLNSLSVDNFPLVEGVEHKKPISSE